MPRVYVVFRNQLFRDAIGAILRACPDIELVGCTDKPEQSAKAVAALVPDVILAEETGDRPVIADLQMILASPKSYRLITLRMDDDGMQVWSRSWHQRVGPQDLVEAIVRAGGAKS